MKTTSTKTSKFKTTTSKSSQKKVVVSQQRQNITTKPKLKKQTKITPYTSPLSPNIVSPALSISSVSHQHVTNTIDINVVNNTRSIAMKTATNRISSPTLSTPHSQQQKPLTNTTLVPNTSLSTLNGGFIGQHRSFTTSPSLNIHTIQQNKFTTKAKKPETADFMDDLADLGELDDLEAEIARIQKELADLAITTGEQVNLKNIALEDLSNLSSAPPTSQDENIDGEIVVKKVKKEKKEKTTEKKEKVEKKEKRAKKADKSAFESVTTPVPPPPSDTNDTTSQETTTVNDTVTTAVDGNGTTVDSTEITEGEKTEDGVEKKSKKATKAKPKDTKEAAVEPGSTPPDGETPSVNPETGLLSQTITVAALAGATVKKNSAAAQRAKLAAAASAAAQAAVDSATNNIDLPDVVTIPPPDTVVVNDYESAKRVLDILTRPDVKKRYHACDTETTGIDPKIQSPVGHGTVICASIYVGPDIDFGGGARIWIDNYGKASGTLDFFKDYFEDVEIKKVWHNYSFDRHILYNHGINCIGFGGDTMHMARLWNSGRTGEGANYGLESLTKDLVTEIPGKESMTTRFGHKKILKNGEEGKVTVVPGTLELQLGESSRTEWIDYSVRDAQATWYLRERLQRELEQWPWTGQMTMMDFYQRYWLPFGEMLTDMERVGIHVRRNDYLPELRKRAEADRAECDEKFLAWARKVKPECQYMNSSSEQQKQQLFFAPIDDKDIHRSGLEMSREFETENIWGYIEPGKTKPKKNFKFSLTGLGLPVLARTPLGKPQINMVVLKELAGNPFGKTPKYGKAYDLLGGGDAGREACEAMYQLIKLAGIDVTISTFIDPLTVMPDQNDRVHCSLNLNTETGRLSARKPNLQNQPSMDKDVYKIRDAFSADKGNKFIVSDYGQLELRVLAHITKCQSMIEAFRLGGDFHSRTAMGMYKYVSDAVSNGDVLLEWDFANGDPPKPLLKDKYGNERKKAKILNFSIAYGKTARGLAQDFGVSVQEAKETVDAWYADRPEVLEWQKRTIAEARRTGVTRTLMGRYRPLHGINDPKPFIRGHAERMAINTPVQGGAADLVAAAMLKLHAHQEFRDLGYKIVLQVHDELIVEGPETNVDRAFQIVKECMEHPFKQDLLVHLVVDSNIANTWYEGK